MHERDLPSNIALFYRRTKVTKKFTQLDNLWMEKLVSLLLSETGNLFEGRNPKISIIQWSVHVSLTGRNYEQVWWYWPWHLIIIYKFDQIDEADCMFIFQIKHQYSFWIIAHMTLNTNQSIIYYSMHCYGFSWPRSSHSVT